MLQFTRIGLGIMLLASGQAAPLPFSVGETLRYDARIGRLSAGSATTTVTRMESVRGARVFVFTMSGTGGAPGLRADYAMTSRAGGAPFQSRRFDRRVTLAGRTDEHHFEIVGDSLRYREVGSRQDWVTPAAPLDELAMLYYLRTLPLRVGETRSLRGYFKNGYNPLTVSVTEREGVVLGDGSSAPCLLVRIVSAGTRSDLWLTDDARRLPAQLDLPLSYGRVRLVLRSRP